MKLLFPTTLSAFVAAALASSSPSVTIDAGTLHGGKCSDGQAVYYRGIPFAEPPVGELRLEPPKSYTKNYPNGGLNATTPAATCIQFGDQMTPPGKKSEDCLYLDVWTPFTATKDSKLPVKVWVYGGSDKSGGIEYPLYDGCGIADAGSILVSVNYRLGPLGFMALDSAGIQGNQGIQDIILALDWVQKSISAFGGDPKKVVLFGQSAGATDVYSVATLPQAPSLINSAIVESVALATLTTNSTIQMTGASFAQTLNCSVDDKPCLQSKSASDFQKAYSSDPIFKKGLGTIDNINVPNRKTPKFWPYVDGTVINENPVTRGIQVPTVFGFNQREGMMDALTKYDTRQAVGALTAADYKKFLRGNWGPAASKIEEYYPLSLFEKATGSTAEGILVAIAIVLTDSHYKCPTYQIAETAAKKNMPSWVYEFTHNSTCVWLDTMPQEDIAVFGAAHTAELPYVFGNLYFDFPNNNNTCNATMAEWDLSKEMIGLWTAMAETAKPSTDDIDWPRFKITPNGTDIPTMIFGNSSTPDKIDFSVCKLWEEVFSIVNANNNVTATGTPSTGSGSGSSSGSGSTTPTASLMNDAVTISSGIGGSVVLSVLLTAAATFGFAGLAI